MGPQGPTVTVPVGIKSLAEIKSGRNNRHIPRSNYFCRSKGKKVIYPTLSLTLFCTHVPRLVFHKSSMLRVDRVKRLAAMQATDKINRGTGMVPRVRPEEGLKHGIGWRQRMAAYDMIAGVRPKLWNEVR